MQRNPKDIISLFGKKKGNSDWRSNWNYLMLHYGYFSKEEFLDMDSEDIIFLIEELKEYNKKSSGSIGSKGSFRR
jgi:hypothetical protein